MLYSHHDVQPLHLGRAMRCRLENQTEQTDRTFFFYSFRGRKQDCNTCSIRVLSWEKNSMDFKITNLIKMWNYKLSYLWQLWKFYLEKNHKKVIWCFSDFLYICKWELSENLSSMAIFIIKDKDRLEINVVIIYIRHLYGIDRWFNIYLTLTIFVLCIRVGSCCAC